MALKIKTKVALGVVFLFLLLTLVGGISFFYFNKFTSETKIMLQANYRTLDYTKGMLESLDDWNLNNKNARQQFEQNLDAQEKNITEPGEYNATHVLRLHYDTFLLHKDSLRLIASMRDDLSHIMQINLKAITVKNNSIQQSAESVKVIITLILTVCVLVGFTFIVNFPGFIANPISKLTEGIKAIAAKNYGQRIYLNREDEFGELANAFNTMAEQLDQYENSNLARILFEKKRAETVINSLQDASIGIDNKNIILFSNKQALNLLNLKEADVVGKKTEVVAMRNDLFKYLVNEKNNIPFKVVVENRENYFTKETIDIPGTEGEAGYVIVVKNITSFKELDVAKTNFIATISHELKTPLASSDFSLKLLEDERVGSLNADQKELVQNIRTDNQRMLRILSELLDLSQVESGKIHLNLQPISPKELIQKAIDSTANAAKAKHINIQTNIATEKNVLADSDKTTWVLNNFISNAIKHSNENTSIIIDVKENTSHVNFHVKDEGTGIDKKYLPHVFDRFFKVPGQKGGTGLGLAISKEFIEAMGGTIYANSQLGKGSTFSFDLKKA